jgi:hypothetical protein
VESARAGAETAKINLDYSSIFSPVNGRTGKHLVALIAWVISQPSVEIT